MPGLASFMKWALPVVFVVGISQGMGGVFGSPTRPLTPATKDNFVNVRTDDPDIAAARERARASLDHFWTRWSKPGQGETGFNLKVGLPTRDGSLENIWVRDIRRADGKINGRLANDPVNIAGMRGDSPVTFSEAQISDWTYNRNGRIVGNETGKVLLERMPVEQRDKYRAMFDER